MGGEFGGEWIHVYVCLSPFALHLKLSQHCLLIDYTPMQNKKLKKLKYFRKIEKKKKAFDSPLWHEASLAHLFFLPSSNPYQAH